MDLVYAVLFNKEQSLQQDLIMNCQLPTLPAAGEMSASVLRGWRPLDG